MQLGIKDKSALVTGGSHGIGLEIARQLAEEGCRVLICSRNEKKLSDAQEYIGECETFVCDVLDCDSVQKVIESISSSGGVDILVNNVGGGGRWGRDDVDSFDEIIWDQVYEKNLKSTARFTLGLLPFMRQKEWGRVIAITSIYGREVGCRPWFNVSKCAQTAFMKSLSRRKELIRKNITFNSVAPGLIMIPDTGWESLKKHDPLEFDRITEEHPMGRLGTAEEVASLVAFLCSNKATWINGASLAVDGGESSCF